MRGELNLVCGQIELFQQFASVAMSEDSIRREIVGRMHEMRVRRRCLSSSAYAGFRIADDAMLHIDETRLNQRRQREDDRSRITSRVGNKTSLSDLIAVQFGATVDCLGLKRAGMFGVGI